MTYGEAAVRRIEAVRPVVDADPSLAVVGVDRALEQTLIGLVPTEALKRFERATREHERAIGRQPHPYVTWRAVWWRTHGITPGGRRYQAYLRSLRSLANACRHHGNERVSKSQAVWWIDWAANFLRDLRSAHWMGLVDDTLHSSRTEDESGIPVLPCNPWVSLRPLLEAAPGGSISLSCKSCGVLLAYHTLPRLGGSTELH